MKTTLWLTTFTMLAASPLGFSKTELESLRSLVAEQERQIRHLETENAKLRTITDEVTKEQVKHSVPAKQQEAAPVATAQTYTVKAGDTLSKIGRKVGSSPEALARLNGIKDPTRLRIGQKLKLPGSTTASSKPAASAPAAPAPASGDTHLVREGDTFYSIARKYKLSQDALIAANPDLNPATLRAGQLVRLHGKPAASTAAAPVRKSTETTSAPKSTPAPVASQKSTVPAQKETAPAPPPSQAAHSEPAKGSVKSVIIDGEITYGEFAAKHGTQVDRLNELNGLDLPQNTVLAKGSELYVYAQP